MSWVSQERTYEQISALTTEDAVGAAGIAADSPCRGCTLANAACKAALDETQEAWSYRRLAERDPNWRAVNSGAARAKTAAAESRLAFAGQLVGACMEERGGYDPAAGGCQMLADLSLGQQTRLSWEARVGVPQMPPEPAE